MKWMKNSEGKADAMLTLGVVSLGVVLLKFLASEMTFGPIIFGQLDSGVVAAILTPCLGAYVARRHSDKKHSKKEENENSK